MRASQRVGDFSENFILLYLKIVNLKFPSSSSHEIYFFAAVAAADFEMFIVYVFKYIFSRSRSVLLTMLVVSFSFSLFHLLLTKALYHPFLSLEMIFIE
jgi:hypothetical protein